MDSEEQRLVDLDWKEHPTSRRLAADLRKKRDEHMSALLRAAMNTTDVIVARRAATLHVYQSMVEAFDGQK